MKIPQELNPKLLPRFYFEVEYFRKNVENILKKCAEKIGENFNRITWRKQKLICCEMPGTSLDGISQPLYRKVRYYLKKSQKELLVEFPKVVLFEFFKKTIEESHK